MYGLNYFSKRCFSSRIYMWSSRAKLSRRPTDLKQQFSIKSGVPTRLTFFDDLNAEKLYIGPRHSSVITKDGSLYTFGAGSWGVLGQGDEKSYSPDNPQKVKFFENKGIKVKDCKLGEYHSVVLTESGEVYTWGYGGKEGYFSWMVSQEVGALGHNDRKPYFVPKKVEFFDTIDGKVEQIAAGLYHTVALTSDGDVYTWGRGQYGVLGNGSNLLSLVPELNEDFKILKDEGINVVKIDSADDYTAILMDNGEVFAFGKNDRGQLGIDSGIGIDMLESSANPSPLVFDRVEPVPMVDVY
jgi:alpha-tubulin suppressor-like RCC1 family protein